MVTNTIVRTDRASIRAKVEVIATARHWTISETIEQGLDALAKQEGIDLSAVADPSVNGDEADRRPCDPQTKAGAGNGSLN